MKILLVEDETNALETMVYLISTNFPEHTVVPFPDAQSALEEMQLAPADVVLTDIQMSGMDGLSLMSAIRARNVDCPIIVVSAYDRFAYAQRALQQQAFDYLLKPFERQHFLDTVSRALQQAAHMQAAAPDSRISPDAFVHGACCAQAYLVFEDARGNSLTRSQQEWQEHISFLSEACARIRPGVNAAVFNRRKESGSALLIILAYSAAEPSADETKTLCASLYEAIQGCQMPLRTRLRLSAGRVTTPESIRTSIREAETASEYSFYDASCECFDNAECLVSSAVLSTAQLEEALRKRNPEEIRMLLTRATDQAYRAHKAPYVFRREADSQLSELLLSLRSVLCLSDVVHFSEVRSRLTTLLTAEDWITGTAMLLKEVGERVDEVRNSRSATQIETCVEYIRTRYSDPNLTLRDISEAFNYNPTYFSSVFKKQLGVTIVQYLVTTRLEAAKELLMHTDLKLSEIAARVGYNDLHYFMRVFKANEGMTPSSYKRKERRSKTK